MLASGRAGLRLLAARLEASLCATQQSCSYAAAAAEPALAQDQQSRWDNNQAAVLYGPKVRSLDMCLRILACVRLPVEVRQRRGRRTVLYMCTVDVSAHACLQSSVCVPAAGPALGETPTGTGDCS